MSIISSLPYNLVNNTVADASQVMSDFNQIVTGVNTNAAKNGVNSDITSLTGLTTPLAVTEGGTGQTSYGNSGELLVSSGTGIAPTWKSVVAAVLEVVYPVGSLYYNASSATNPSSLLGFGTWTAFAAGRVPVGVGTGTDGNGDTLVVTSGGTGGEYNHTLTQTEMPSHTHYDSGHTHALPDAAKFIPSASQFGTNTNGVTTGATASVGNANIQNTGGGAKHNITQPYIGVYIWQRTA